MSITPPNQSTSVSDSWVDLSGQCSFSGPHTPNRVTPLPFGGEQDYLHMLKEAQRESNRSSTKVSPISSALMSLSSTTRNTPSASPKSPPNSPNPEFAHFPEDFKGVYINPSPTGSIQSQVVGINQPVTASELIWDWTSKPNIPPREWLKSACNSDSSCPSSGDKSGNSKTGKSFYSKGVLYTLLLTNLFSLLLGAGLGMWISKHGAGQAGVIDVAI